MSPLDTRNAARRSGCSFEQIEEKERHLNKVKKGAKGYLLYVFENEPVLEEFQHRLERDRCSNRRSHKSKIVRLVQNEDREREVDRLEKKVKERFLSVNNKSEGNSIYVLTRADLQWALEKLSLSTSNERMPCLAEASFPCRAKK